MFVYKASLLYKEIWVLCCVIVLVSVDIELFFFIIPGMVLWFWYRRKIILITHWCFNFHREVLTLSQELLSISYCPASEETVHKKLGKGQNQESWPKLAKEMFHTIWGSCRTIKNRVVGAWEQAGHFVLLVCVCINIYNYYLYYFFFFLYCPMKLSLSQHISLTPSLPLPPHSPPQFSPPSTEGEQANGYVVFSCLLA